MADYDNRNTFVLFRNSKKEKDTHADFTGTFTDADGNEHYINGWTKTPKNGGEKFIAGNMKPKQQQSAPASRPMKAAALNDEVPF